MLNLRLAVLGGLVLLPALAAGGRLARRYGLPSTVGSDVVWWGLVGYVVAARVAWIALHPWVLRYPADALRVTQGLLTPAGILGAAAVVAVLRWRRHGDTSWAAVTAFAAAGAAAGAAGWYSACWLQERCGGVVVAWGPPLEAGVPQLPIGPVAALACVALLVVLWRSGRPSLARAWSVLGGVLAVVAASGALALRARPWPAWPDLAVAGLAAAGLLAAVWLWARSDVAGEGREGEEMGTGEGVQRRLDPEQSSGG